MIRDIQNIDDYICRAARVIKEKLYSDPDIIEALHNPDLDPNEPDAYIGVNIFDYIRIPGTITEKINYICFDIKQEGLAERNNHMQNLIYTFAAFAHVDDMDTGIGISRHNLLGYLIRDIFNYSDMFGTQLVEIQDTPGIMDSQHSSRTIMFKEITPANLQHGVRINKYEY